jgi:hypothetical protein
MPRKITVSDTNAKLKCMEYLRTVGYVDSRVAKKNENCDIITFKNQQKFFFEVKYSSKESGEKFFGTVMLTELWYSIQNKDNYRFIVCRGNAINLNEWFFRIFEVDEFMKLCTLTTPIFHYHLNFDSNENIILPNFKSTTIKAEEQLIETMWSEFQNWKTKKKIV